MTQLSQIARWVATTPTLFSAHTPLETQPPFTIDLSALDDVYQGNPRLGFLYQHVCHQLFQRHPDFQVEAEEIQLQHKGQTLGAIDFIVRHLPSNALQHWEVAIKFYLLKDGLWFGPNAHDQLDKKLTRMISHQLQMSQTDAFTERYPHWPTMTQHLLMQGRLYINPFDPQPIPPTCLGYALNPERIKGLWCYQSQRPQITQTLYQLDKPQWISGRDASSPVVTGVTERFIHCQDDTGRFWFIVPDQWPNNSQ